MNAVELLLPVLALFTPTMVPAAILQTWLTAANQKQAERLARHLKYELELIYQHLSTRINYAYIESDGFQANVVQAIRASEVAESEDKLRFIARSLASCTLNFDVEEIDKFQSMRIIDSLSHKEIIVFSKYFKILASLDPHKDFAPTDGSVNIEGLSRKEFVTALLGLEQLGLFTRNPISELDGLWTDMPTSSGPGFAWKLTALARQVAALSRLNLEEA